MSSIHQLQQWIRQTALNIDESFQLPDFPDDPQISGKNKGITGYAQLRQHLYAWRKEASTLSFGEAIRRQLWEKVRLFPAETLQDLPPPLKQDLVMTLLLDTARECDDAKVRIAAASKGVPTAATRPLIRRLFRILNEEEGEQVFYRLINAFQQSVLPKESLRLYLELWAEHPRDVMTSEMMNRLLEHSYPSEISLRALLQCAGTNRHNQGLLADWLKETHFEACSPRLQQAMMDYCVRQATPRTYSLLLDWGEKLEAGPVRDIWIREYLKMSMDACGRLVCEPVSRNSPAANQVISETIHKKAGGLTLAQFMFYGDLMLPGKANSGGIATLLRTLGDALVEQPGVEAVYTFMMMPCDERTADSSLTTLLSPGHTLVRVPVFFNEACSPELFQEKEYDIGHTLERMLELLQINPDVYHMRYSDHASLAAASLAKRRGKKAVFTLTPDPHRNIRVFEESQDKEGDESGQDQVPQADAVITQLSKVRAADDLLGLCDGVLGIGTEAGKAPLTAYFPQLKPAVETGKIQFRMMPEGIRLKEDQPAVERAPTKDPWDLMTSPDGKYRLAPHRKHLPILLTVGRLDPVKGQLTLLEAWSDHRLSQAYNLVIIGGDTEQPDAREKAILEAVDEFMAENPPLMGGFCHLGRMDNHLLRQLQQDLAEGAPGRTPPLYVAPSRKEEFGLSIIEAMAAGMAVAGPKAGGVGSYVVHGVNGFLLETGTVAQLRKELVALLIEASRTREEWAAIAQRGKATVETRFDIRQVAAEFAAFYRAVLNQEAKGEETSE